MALYFASDVHLDDSRPELQSAFIAFLNAHQSDMQGLYLLGDLFEYWIGDDYLSPQTLTVIRRLRALTDSGVPLYIQHGNRDFLIGQRFIGLTGATLIPEVHQLKIGDRQTLVCHGDQLCTLDAQYQRARHWLRKPWVQGLLKSLPRLMRIRTAERARKHSKNHQKNQMDKALDVSPVAVANLMDSTQAEVLIHGHTHRPDVHAMRDNKQRFVLGSWNETGGVYVKATANDIIPVTFTLVTQ